MTLSPTSFIVLCVVMTSSIYAQPPSNTQSVSGQLRLGYVNRDNSGGSTDTFAIGGKLGYHSKKYRGLSARVTFYTTNPVAGIDDDPLFLDTNGRGYSILGEAFISADMPAKPARTSLKLGRQQLDTPFADSDDVGMIPNTFEAMTIHNHSLVNTTLVAAHLHRWAGVDAPKPGKFSKMNDDNGVNVVAALYEPSDKWNLQGWYYNASNATDISYVEAAIHPSEKSGLSAQYATQNGAGFEGDVWGVAAEYGIGDLSLSAAHNQVSGGQVSNGFGGGPFFTSAEDHTIAEVDNQKATLLGVEYGASKKLSLAVTHVDFSKGEDELDMSASYRLGKNLTVDLIYSDMDKDGKLSRAFINYNF